MEAKKESPHVQINYNYFNSFGFPNNGVEEQIYKKLCEEFCQAKSREDIKAVPKERLYESLSIKEELVEVALAKLQATKGGYNIIIEKDGMIMPGKHFGILR